MKAQHALVFVLVIIGVTYLAYRNPSGMSGMFMKDSDGSALGGPVYSTAKARISAGYHGAQVASYDGLTSQFLNRPNWRFQRGQ